MTGSSRYTERLVPGIGGWFSSLAGSALLGLVALAVGPSTALVVTIAAVVVAAIVVWMLSPVVSVTGHELVAGDAHIDVDLLGEPEVLDADDVRRALGPGSDARTYACLRTATKHAVRAEVLDPRDPTPAWLVSTRHPERLVAALTAARSEVSAG
ncbi:DUF3093 domain-containing protein [Paraoerskovia marina]|uniref:DUF3093 domain-containing protein n=1 Tax=Paraoerskovia marina TaxID=545619 RepID=A0A1H1SE61_9CELL|nr:DUF3093 domain-containing protein [Paraoerskovia marina]SDS45659.1 Protein of unknown function [Paraoerskovia marina]